MSTSLNLQAPCEQAESVDILNDNIVPNTDMIVSEIRNTNSEEATSQSDAIESESEEHTISDVVNENVECKQDSVESIFPSEEVTVPLKTVSDKMSGSLRNLHKKSKKSKVNTVSKKKIKKK